MKILIVGDVLGHIHKINEYIEKTSAELVISTGDFGIFAKPYAPNADFNTENDFCDYISGKKEFLSPVVTVYGAHDNIKLAYKIIEGDISIKNFNIVNGKNIYTALNKDGKEDKLPISNIRVGGIGGSYSPKIYKNGFVDFKDFRHFCEFDVQELKNVGLEFLVMHDLIGDCTSKKVKFSEDTYSLIETTSPLYCFIGKYHWFGSLKLVGTNIVIMPKAKDGYLLLDTKEWDCEFIRAI